MNLIGGGGWTVTGYGIITFFILILLAAEVGSDRDLPGGHGLGVPDRVLQQLVPLPGELLPLVALPLQLLSVLPNPLELPAHQLPHHIQALVQERGRLVKSLLAHIAAPHT